MGKHVNGLLYNLVAWTTTVIVSASSLLLIAVTIIR
jgi:hypothetical protein